MSTASDHPSAVGGAVVALVAVAEPILIAFRVPKNIVETVGVAVVPFVAFVTAIVHSLVTPAKNVALTVKQAAALRAPDLPAPAPVVAA